MVSSDQVPRAVAPFQVPQRAPVQVGAATFTTSTTMMLADMLKRFVFHGDIPASLYGWLQVAVPGALGFLGAELVYRRSVRQATYQ